MGSVVSPTYFVIGFEDSCYALLALDAIATELEDPFGTEDNDLPLNAICNAIEIDLREMLKDSIIPPKMKPDAHYRLL